MTIHRKIGGFEYDYEEEKCKDIYDHGTIIESVKHTVIIKKTPRGVDGYKDNAELLDFIIALERSGELDKVRTEYLGGVNDYGRITKPYEPPYTWSYEDGSIDGNLILCNNNEHDAKTRTLIGESSNARTKLSSKNLSTQAYRYKENRREEKERA